MNTEDKNDDDIGGKIYKLKEGSKVEFVARCGFYRIATIKSLNGEEFVGRTCDASPSLVKGRLVDITRVVDF